MSYMSFVYIDKIVPDIYPLKLLDTENCFYEAILQSLIPNYQSINRVMVVTNFREILSQHVQLDDVDRLLQMLFGTTLEEIFHPETHVLTTDFSSLFLESYRSKKEEVELFVKQAQTPSQVVEFLQERVRQFGVRAEDIEARLVNFILQNKGTSIIQELNYRHSLKLRQENLNLLIITDESPVSLLTHMLPLDKTLKTILLYESSCDQYHSVHSKDEGSLFKPDGQTMELITSYQRGRLKVPLVKKQQEQEQRQEQRQQLGRQSRQQGREMQQRGLETAQIGSGWPYGEGIDGSVLFEQFISEIVSLF